jgi:hypothetical protein
MIDVFIPLGPNDGDLIKTVVQHAVKNVVDVGNVHIVTSQDLSTVDWESDNVFVHDENIFSEYWDYIPIKERKGWYFQQLLKLLAWQKITISDTYLVLDADTFILKPCVFTLDGKIQFNVGTEHHDEYFKHMTKLHPSLQRVHNNYSGICHMMPFDQSIIKNLITMVETYHAVINNIRKPFWKLFIDVVDLSQESAASEYEIFFNYCCSFHTRKCNIRKLKWENCNDDTYINNNEKDLDYISIHWYLRN